LLGLEGLVRLIHIDDNTIKYRRKAGKNLFAITPKGRESFDLFLKEKYLRFVHVKDVLGHMLKDMTNRGSGYKILLEDEERRFLTKLINVRDLIRYLTLRELQRKNTIHGWEMYKLILDKYGWQMSDGYFYDILRKMENPKKDDDKITKRSRSLGKLEELPLIYSMWEEPERKVRKYSINEFGKEYFAQTEQSVVEQLEVIIKYLRSIISLFSDDLN
jgi:DNA-binding PadR family transcriptional regulator